MFQVYSLQFLKIHGNLLFQVKNNQLAGSFSLEKARGLLMYSPRRMTVWALSDYISFDRITYCLSLKNEGSTIQTCLLELRALPGLLCDLALTSNEVDS